jgi:hypothetical protein
MPNSSKLTRIKSAISGSSSTINTLSVIIFVLTLQKICDQGIFAYNKQDT